jgi:hypothetical protein
VSMLRESIGLGIYGCRSDPVGRSSPSHSSLAGSIAEGTQQQVDTYRAISPRFAIRIERMGLASVE